jgi:hypothetical protein
MNWHNLIVLSMWTVDGTRKWSAGTDWFYTIEENNE